MKKVLLIGLLLTITVGLAWAQTFKVVYHPDNVGYANAGDLGVQLGGYVVNLTNQEISVSMYRDQTLPDGWTTSMCFGTTCGSPMTNSIENIPIAAQDSVTFDITFNTASTPDSTQITISFYDANNNYYEQHSFYLSTLPTFQVTVDTSDSLITVQAGEEVSKTFYVTNTSKRERVFEISAVAPQLFPEDWDVSISAGENAGDSTLILPIPAGDSCMVNLHISTHQEYAATALFQVSVKDTALTFSKTWDLKVVAVLPEPALAIAHCDTLLEKITAGEQAVLGGYLFNLTDSLLTVHMVRAQQHLPEGWLTSLCFDNCADPAQDTVTSILNGLDSLAFSVTFYTDSVPGRGTVDIELYADGPGDTVKTQFAVNTAATALEHPGANVPRTLTLLGNYPNPFNPQTTISYYLPRAEKVDLEIYTLEGKKVAGWHNIPQKPGLQMMRVNGTNWPSGTYFYRISAGNKTVYGKMILIK